MADIRKRTDGPTPFDEKAYDYTLLPEYDDEFISEEDVEAFERALNAPEGAGGANGPSSSQNLFITALNDWRPVHQRVRKDGEVKRKRRKAPLRGKDETREGYVYTLLKYPLLLLASAWIVVLSAFYVFTRIYIWLYEHYITMRGKRNKLRSKLHATKSYADWVDVAKEMDTYLGNDVWKETDEYAYYNSNTIRNVRDELRRIRTALEGGQLSGEDIHQTNGENAAKRQGLVEELRVLCEAAVKNNFVGVENPKLYSETYYGTKELVQSFTDELELSLQALRQTDELGPDEKAVIFNNISTNYGRSALCLSGGATFAYYHFGVAKALLDAGILPQFITGTSGGALIAALLSCRTDEELKKLLVPALAYKIKACQEGLTEWVPRWLRTGARFDSLDWARRCSWWTMGSLTFREAYERTGRVLNVTCIPSDPHSPTVLANYKTAPDCVVWSAVIASAAVPGILNPVVLMRKDRHGRLHPYSFGAKWKDGSLRTDIPLKALNTNFNVNFSIVSQVNPHVNLFFFSSRGTVGRPVTHRRGRGWRGGFLGSAIEQYLKLELTKWLKVMRHLELLPRYFGQDWSEVWLQRFSGTITIWPKSIPSDFLHILSDPSMDRLARMLHVGQHSAFPKLLFIANRTKIERQVEAGVREFVHPGPDRPSSSARGSSAHTPLVSEDESEASSYVEAGRARAHQIMNGAEVESLLALKPMTSRESAQVVKANNGRGAALEPTSKGWAEKWAQQRKGSMIAELGRQSSVFFDDTAEESADEDEEPWFQSQDVAEEGERNGGGGKSLRRSDTM